MKHLFGFQLDHVEKILQELSVISDGQNDTETTLDEEDELERQKLPEYINRFKVSLPHVINSLNIYAFTYKKIIFFYVYDLICQALKVNV